MRKAVLCFLKKGNQVLLLNTQYPDKLVWNGVSGYIDEGETPQHAVVREVMEEIGVEIKADELQYLGSHGIFKVFTVENWEGKPELREQSIVDLKWFPILNLPFDKMHTGNEDWLPGFLR